MKKILITPRSFGKTKGDALELIRQSGYVPVVNPYARIMTREEMKRQLADAAGVIVGVDPLDEEVLGCAEGLRAVAKYGVGTDNIDLDYCEKHAITVSVTAGANTEAVADYTFALLLGAARKLTVIDRMCHERDWSKVTGLDVYGKTLGILGFGAIGRAVARRAGGFAMRILAYDAVWDETAAERCGVRYAVPDQIYAESDFISLHLPLTPETRHIVCADTIGKIKTGAILVNTARGGLVDEAALAQALSNGRLTGAGIDVFDREPPEDDALYRLENLIMGSHCAASTVGAAENMSMRAAENLIRDLRNCAQPV